MGGSIGISVMQGLAVANTQVMHQSLAATINPADPVVTAGLAQWFDPATIPGLWALNEEVTRQAAMVAYVNDFHLMILIIFICAPMLLLMRPARAQAEGPAHAYAE
jgi:DHA2 family multidrug resistance protein